MALTAPGFDSLAEAFEYPKGTKNVIGMVVEKPFPPKKTRTNEWMLTFIINDHKLARKNTPYGGIKVRIFCDEEAQLPHINGVGDVIILRAVQATVFSAAPLLCSVKRQTSYAVFPKACIPAVVPKSQGRGQDMPTEICKSICYTPLQPWTPSQEEQEFVVRMKSATEKALGDTGVSAVEDSKDSNVVKPPAREQKLHGRSEKFTLIQDAAFNKFYDILVEIVKIFPTQNGAYEVYVTDYTSNPMLFNYPSPYEKDDSLGVQDGDEFGYMMPTSKRDWPGPYGSMTLTIEVHQPHASVFESRVKDGDIIYISNMRVKQSRQNKMEGNLWTDYKFPNKISIHPVELDQDDPTQKALAKRRDDYKTKLARQQAQQTPSESHEKLSKGQKKRKRDKAKKAERKQKTQADHHEQPSNNKNIRCIVRQDIELLPLSSLTPPLQPANAKNSKPDTSLRLSRVRVRVVDFYPPKIEDFSEPVGATQDSDYDPIDLDYLTPQWEWSFTLLVEDAYASKSSAEEVKAQVWLQVNHQDAEFLLNQEATDLKTDARNLARLREQMAILWGNLEERKRGAQERGELYPPEKNKPQDEDRISAADHKLSNLPFECFVKGQTLELDKEDRTESAVAMQVFSMFGTSIK